MKMALFVFTIALATVFPAWSQANASDTRKNPLDGTWELVSGQQLPKGARDVKIISDGHFIFVAYESGSGKPLYTGGGTYVLNGNSYIEHMDFASDKIASLIGKDQSFTVNINENTFTQTGALSNGKSLSEVWKRKTP